MDRRSVKEITRMGNVFLNNVGIEVDMRLIVGTNLTVFELGAVGKV